MCRVSYTIVSISFIGGRLGWGPMGGEGKTRGTKNGLFGGMGCTDPIDVSLARCYSDESESKRAFQQY